MFSDPCKPENFSLILSTWMYILKVSSMMHCTDVLCTEVKFKSIITDFGSTICQSGGQHQ